MSIEGSTTVVHRFEGSTQLKVMSVTPQPTEHSLDRPDA